MKLSWENSNNFEIYVMDLCESIKPKKCEDLESLAEELHQSIETAIEDFIRDSEEFDIDDYEPVY